MAMYIQVISNHDQSATIQYFTGKIDTFLLHCAHMICVTEELVLWLISIPGKLSWPHSKKFNLLILTLL